MQQVFIIAKNTFKQVIRDKILYGILVFALLFLGSTVVLSSLSLGEDAFVMRNFGLAGIYIFGLIITIFLGASIVSEELERKTTYFLLAKPVTRANMIWGRFFGLLTGISITTLLMAGVYLLIVFLNGGGFDHAAIWAIGLQLFEMAILISILILLSMFTSPLSATIYTILILYIGHLLSLIQALALSSGRITKTILLAVYYLAPNLEKFDIRNLIVHNLPIPFKEILMSLGYAVLYVVLTIYIAQKILARKDL
ncbi:MAG: ABC transporter permease subunit [Candidatus Taylorbacteria bacterium]|nr:ABC transporter permease subunit [Candidatus Taylorbacteria bacterium]